MSGPASTARAEFLKTQDRFAVSSSSALASTWGEDALDSRQPSVLDTEAAATAEAARQTGLLGTVRARDAALLEGVHFDLEGKTARLAYDGRLGLSGERDMLVVSVRIDLNSGTTLIEGEVILP